MTVAEARRRVDQWHLFSDAEIEVLADYLVEAGEPHYQRGVTADEVSDPEYVNAHWKLLDDLRAERITRGFDGGQRIGSPDRSSLG